MANFGSAIDRNYRIGYNERQKTGREGEQTRIDREEALRYLGIRRADPETRAKMDVIARYAEETFPPRYAYRIFSVENTEEGAALPEAGLVLPGKTAALTLREAKKAALLLCTLGLGFDAALRGAQARDMARAVMLDACGSALAEAGCDAAERELKALYPALYLTDRFSPGYGDLPLALQPGLLAALDGQRRLGVYLTDGFLMNPSKSVTAVIGLCDSPQRARVRGCAYCAMKNGCEYRKRGTACEKV